MISVILVLEIVAGSLALHYKGKASFLNIMDRKSDGPVLAASPLTSVLALYSVNLNEINNLERNVMVIVAGGQAENVPGRYDQTVLRRRAIRGW